MGAALALIVVTTLALASCATHAVWLGGTPVIEEYTDMVVVRIYRAGPHCRLEVITDTATTITLPTRCLTVPHVARP
jgi:hypothetical protein